MIAPRKLSCSRCTYLSSHDVDLLRWITGQSPTSVYVGASAFNPDVAEIGDFDVLDMIFKFESGVVGTVDVARLAVYGYGLYLSKNPE